MNFKRLVSTSFLGQSCQQGFEDPVWCFNNFCTSLLVELLALKVLSRTSIASCTWASHGLKHCLKYILWYLSQVMRHSLSCACATNCFAHAHTIALCMFAQLLCACPIYNTSHRHAHAIALHMRKPLLCTCASHRFAHAQAITLHMRAPLLCTCAPHYTAHVHNSQTCSLDWLARSRLMRENTRKSGTASSILKGSHSLMRNISTPESSRRKPEVIVVEDNMASTKTNTSKRWGSVLLLNVNLAHNPIYYFMSWLKR